MSGEVSERVSVRAVLERLYREGRTVAADGTVHDVFPVAIPEPEGVALREWVRRERPSRVLEIGLGYGVAALWVQEALGPDAEHVAVDAYQRTRFGGCALDLLDEAGVGDRVAVYEGDSQLVLPHLLADDQTFDLAVIDGNHRFEGVFVDLAYVARLLTPGSVVFLDDHQLPAVAKAAAYFTANRDWRVEEVSAADPLHHWAVLRTPPEPRTYAFAEFTDF